MKRYIAVKTTPNSKVNATHLKVDMSYDLGGMNMYNYRQEARGYYLTVFPVEREVCSSGVTMESFTAYTGIKMLLKEVKRKSAKAEQEAERMVDQNLPMLVNAVLQKNGLELEEGEL